MLKVSFGALRAQLLTLVGTLAVITAVWWVVTTVGAVNPSVFPPLDRIRSAGFTVLDQDRSSLSDHLWVTTLRVCVALVLGVLGGFLGGILFWKVPALGRAVEPYLVSFYAVPLVVFYPMLIVMMGINSGPIILLAAVMCSIPVALNTWIGFRGQKEIYGKVGRALQMPPLTRFRLVELPAALPHVFTGVRVGAVYSLVAVVGMEFMYASSGLGYAITFQYESFNVPSMYLFLIVTFLLSFVVITLLAIVNAVALRYDNA
jgi:NitT/TauT family transport system permease protein